MRPFDGRSHRRLARMRIDPQERHRHVTPEEEGGGLAGKGHDRLQTWLGRLGGG
jgi:hypothetical protein